MKTVIYLSNQLVKAAVGEVRKGTLVISQAVAEEAPKLSIVNGQVTDEAAFTQFLEEFWKRHQLSRKKVYLVVSSTQTVVRFFETPKMSHRKMMEYLPREFSDVERLRNPVYSYQILGPGRTIHRQRVLGVVMERSFLTEHVRRFHSMGIQLVSVETALAAELRLLHQLEGLRGRTCAVGLLDGVTLTNILWQEGTFIHFSRTKVCSPAGTPQFGMECARAISALVQFAKAEQVEEELTAAYLGGLRDGELEICEKMIRQLCPHIEVINFSAAAGSSVVFSETTCDLGDFAVPAGGIFTRRGRRNLLNQYRRSPQVLARRAALFRAFAPPAGTVCLLTLVLVLQAANWFHMTNRINSCFDYMSDPLVLSGAARYDRLTAENETLRSRLKATSRIASNIRSYPVMDTRIDQAVDRCAKNLVTAKVVGFQSEAGVIQISSSAADEPSIHQFIDRLAEESGVFSDVDYTGFEYVEDQGIWKLYVECYLNAPKQEETEHSDAFSEARVRKSRGEKRTSAGKEADH